MKTDINHLHERAVRIAKVYLKAESDLIDVLQEIDENRRYKLIQFRSLFEYCTQALSLSDSVSYNLISVARKAKSVPQLKECLRKREITLTNARKIAPILTPSNQEKWLSAASSLSRRELERLIAAENPEHLVLERAKYVSAERLELRVGISEQIFQSVERARDVLSSKLMRAASMEETIGAMALFFLEKNDPLKKAERARPDAGFIAKASRKIPAAVQHAVNLRDQQRCTFIYPDGKRCTERRWLDFHHIQLITEGGLTEPQNLKTLCRAHHQIHHLLRPEPQVKPSSQRKRSENSPLA